MDEKQASTFHSLFRSQCLLPFTGMYKRYEHRNEWMMTRKRWNVIRAMTVLNLEVRTSAGTSVLKEDAHQWSNSFKKLMDSHIGQQVFTSFLETEYSDENMMFWHACEDFKLEKKSVKRQLMAKEMYAMFLKPSAPLEVNIDAKARKNLWTRIFENPSKDIFDEAQEQIYLLMERDCFRRFVRSEKYMEYLKHTEESSRQKSATYENW